MNDKEQRIEIAKACGWINQGKAKQIPTLEHRWTHKDIHPRFINTEELPDYLNDLNAMHEAETLLDDRHKYNDDTRSLYYDYISLGAEGFPDKWEISWHILRATARERAEAFLKTLGKWKDETK